MLVTLLVLKLLIGWLNELVERNISDISVTLEVSKVLTRWLNIAVERNIPTIFVTLDVSQVNGDVPEGGFCIFWIVPDGISVPNPVTTKLVSSVILWTVVI